MAKIEEELVLEAILESGIKPDKAQQILSMARNLALSEKAPKEKTPRTPPNLLLVINDPDGSLPKDLTGWLVQRHPATELLSSNDEVMHGVELEWGDLLIERQLTHMCREHIESQSQGKGKGRKGRMPVTCLGDVMEVVNKKISKDQCGIQVRTKTPIAVIGVNPDVTWQRSDESINRLLNVAKALK